MNKKKYTEREVPTNLPLLFHLVKEHQRINKVRLAAAQKNSALRDDVRNYRLEHQKAAHLLSAYFGLYGDAKAACKEYSALISQMRVEMGAYISWGASHNIRYIKIGDTRYIPEQMDHEIESYKMDTMLFPELEFKLPTDPKPFEERIKALRYVEKELKKKHKRYVAYLDSKRANESQVK